jgi:hypothetical protein
MIEITVRDMRKSNRGGRKLFSFRVWTEGVKKSWVLYEVEAMDFEKKKIHRYNIKFPKRLEKSIWLPHFVLQRYAADIVGNVEEGKK